jgi:hypothetical protein
MAEESSESIEEEKEALTDKRETLVEPHRRLIQPTRGWSRSDGHARNDTGGAGSGIIRTEMATDRKNNFPWIPLVILIVGIIAFWVVPAIEGERTVKVEKAKPVTK